MSLKGPIPGIPKYFSDGKGRDTYISFFNGGFSNYPYSNSYKKDFYGINHKKNHPDLYARRPIVKYNADGSGRDFFIHQNILSEHSRLRDFSDFPRMLRSGEEYNPIMFNKSYGKSKFEKNLLNRIFYGRCTGVKDRLMEPKVKFNNKRMSTDLKYNLTNPNFSENENTKEANNKNKNNNCNKYQNNLIEKDGNSYVKNKNKNKKSFSTDKQRLYKSSIIVEDDKNFINSVQCIYTFNYKKNKGDLPTLI